jgi:hypothetical protein
MSRMLTPQELHHALEVAPSVTLKFYSRKKMLSYRQNLYSVNRQGQFRYSTRQIGWSSLMVLRLK